MRTYILIEVDNINATFTTGNSNYEIYYLAPECTKNVIKKASTIIEAKNQMEAFKFFNMSLGIFKRPNLNYYEKMLTF